MKGALFGCALTTIATNALAEMPHYDVESFCQQVATFADNYNGEMFNACFDSQQSTYRSLKARWSDIDDRVKDHCDGVARTFGIGSYIILDVCVMQESLESQNKTFED